MPCASEDALSITPPAPGAQRVRLATGDFVVRVPAHTGEDQFAEGVQVIGARSLTVEEIVARHQAAAARQAAVVKTLISRGTLTLSFEAPGFPAPVSITLRDNSVFGRRRHRARAAGDPDERRRVHGQRRAAAADHRARSASRRRRWRLRCRTSIATSSPAARPSARHPATSSGSSRPEATRRCSAGVRGSRWTASRWCGCRLPRRTCAVRSSRPSRPTTSNRSGRCLAARALGRAADVRRRVLSDADSPGALDERRTRSTRLISPRGRRARSHPKT